jgi:hypothetical protein
MVIVDVGPCLRISGRALPEPLVQRFAEDASAPVTLLSLVPTHTSVHPPPTGFPRNNGTLCADSCRTDAPSNDSRSRMDFLALNTNQLSPVHVLLLHSHLRDPFAHGLFSPPTRPLLHPALSFRPTSWLGIKHEEKDTGVVTNHSTFVKVHVDAE